MADETTARIDTAEVLAIDEEVARRTGSARFGVTTAGFVPKPFAQLLAEKVALARELFGGDVDLTSGSVIRKLLELTALEDARTWAALSAMYDDQFVVSATGDALSRLGAELGIGRPYEQATGTVELALAGPLPAQYTQLRLPRGARMTTSGGHHVATDETVVLSAGSPRRTVGVRAFYPGPEHDLDPSTPSQVIDGWNETDVSLDELLAVAAAAGPGKAPTDVVSIAHTLPLTGGDALWSDARYRALLLRAPRSLWTVDGVAVAVSRVPGVRQVQVRDAWGGLDINQSIFGNFNFIERLFGSERDLGSPYYFTVLVAPTAAAIWDGPDGLRAQVAAALEDVRPMGIFPRIEPAEEVGVGVSAELVVRGLPLPSGSRATVNASQAAVDLKARLLERMRRYVEALGFGEPVRAAEIVWALMNEPGVSDVQSLRLISYPPSFDALDLGQPVAPGAIDTLSCGTNAVLQANQIAVFIDDPSRLVII